MRTRIEVLGFQTLRSLRRVLFIDSVREPEGRSHPPGGAAYITVNATTVLPELLKPMPLPLFSFVVRSATRRPPTLR